MGDFSIDTIVHFEKDKNVELFMSQFQKYTKYILCVVNHETVTYFNDLASVPQGLVFENRVGDCIYYRHNKSPDLFCFFTEVLKQDTIFREIPSQSKAINDSKSIIILHKNKRHIFSDLNHATVKRKVTI